MPVLPVTKIVGAPAAPATYDPNTLILSRIGDGFDLWLVNNDASGMVRANGTNPEVVLTQAAYDALDPPDPNTDYYISG